MSYLKWMKSAKLSKSACENAKWALEIWLEDIGPAFSANQVTKAWARQWIERKSEHYSNGSQHLLAQVIRSCYNHAINVLEQLTENPFKGIKLQPHSPHEEVFTEAQVQQILHAAPPDIACYCEFLYETGCRPGEAIKLEARHCKTLEDGRYEFVLSPNEHKTGRKTGKPRYICLSKKACEIIKPLLAKYPGGPLFRSTKNGQYQVPNVAARFRRTLAQIGIKQKLTLYSFRHTFATRHLDAGVPIERVATWLGNSVAMVESHYWHAAHRANKNRYAGLDN
jgi:integrase